MLVEERGRSPIPVHRDAGTRRPPSTERPAPLSRPQQAATALLLLVPVAGVVVACVWLVGGTVSILDIVLGAAFYVVAGHGLSVGFHRMATHRGFEAKRPVKIGLMVAGSMAFEGTVISWAANHRRHHAYTDRAGDPHSPHVFGDAPSARIRGAVHAHVGWLFRQQPTDERRWAPDLLDDRDAVVVSRLFPVICLVSLGAPALLGWVLTGTGAGALDAFVWAGLVRVFVLQHSTFAVNSACHIWGRRPFKTRRGDRSTNFAPMALLSMGECWHNAHHSNPRLARHGVLAGQLDSTARVIRILECLGLASEVRWPTAGEPERVGSAGPARPSGPAPVRSPCPVERVRSLA